MCPAVTGGETTDYIEDNIMLPKTLQALLDDPRVDEILDERSSDCGYWLYLKPGWINWMTETHSIHEDAVKEVTHYLRHYVKPCTCEQCAQA